MKWKALCCRHANGGFFSAMRLASATRITPLPEGCAAVKQVLPISKDIVINNDRMRATKRIIHSRVGA